MPAAESYYAGSEQRPARYFALGGDAFALLVAQPDCDTVWLASVGADEIRTICAAEEKPLETRVYRFACGCTSEKIAEAIGPALQGDLDEIFGGDTHIRVSCPRCGTKHEIAREVFDAIS